MTTSEPCSTMMLVTCALIQVRETDPADTGAVLLAAWEGFGAIEAAGRYLPRVDPEDAAVARDAAPGLADMATRLRAVPSLRPTASAGFGTPVEDKQFDAGSGRLTRHGTRDLAYGLSTLLTWAAERAGDPGDRALCEHGVRLADELARAWDSRVRPRR